MALSQKDENFFIKNGYVCIKNALPKDFIQQWWNPRAHFLRENNFYCGQSHLYFPRLRRFRVCEVSPKLDDAIIQLTGGEDRILSPRIWGDGFVVACPQKNQTNVNIDIGKRYLWHKDGFFRHFLDSPEIGLIAFVLWTKVTYENGATAIANGSIKLVAEYLARRPEGVNPDDFSSIIDSNWPDQTRAEGEAGDVFLAHPFLLHAPRPNFSEDYRAITNPHISLKSPMVFDRSNPNEFSPIEKTILTALCKEKITFAAQTKRKLEQSQSENIINEIKEKLKNELQNYGLK